MTKDDLKKQQKAPGFFNTLKLLARHGDWQAVVTAACFMKEKFTDFDESKEPRDFEPEDIFAICRWVRRTIRPEQRDIAKLLGRHKDSPCKNCLYSRASRYGEEFVKTDFANGAVRCHCPELHPDGNGGEFSWGGVSPEQYFDGAPCEHFKEAPEARPEG